MRGFLLVVFICCFCLCPCRFFKTVLLVDVFTSTQPTDNSQHTAQGVLRKIQSALTKCHQTIAAFNGHIQSLDDLHRQGLVGVTEITWAQINTEGGRQQWLSSMSLLPTHVSAAPDAGSGPIGRKHVTNVALLNFHYLSTDMNVAVRLMERMLRISEQQNISRTDMDMLECSWRRERQRVNDFITAFRRLRTLALSDAQAQRSQISRWEGCVSLLSERLQHCGVKLKLVQEAKVKLRTHLNALQACIRTNPFANVAVPVEHVHASAAALPVPVVAAVPAPIPKAIQQSDDEELEPDGMMHDDREGELDAGAGAGRGRDHDHDIDRD